MHFKVNHHIQAHHTTSQHTTHRQHRAVNQQTTQNSLNILQFNKNSTHKQKSELEHILDKHKKDILTMQETKLKKAHKTPQFNNYTTLRQDRSHKAKGGLITLIKDNIIYTLEDIPGNIVGSYDAVALHHLKTQRYTQGISSSSIVCRYNQLISIQCTPQHTPASG